jgi:isoleucyl-tRNA synthetase
MLEEIARLEDYIETELNVKKVEYSTDESQFINLFAKPNSPVLGKRLGKQFKAYKSAIESLTSEAIEALQDSGSIALDGETFSVDDILIFREAMEGTNAVSNRFISIDMDCTLNEQLLSEGLAREVVNRIQKSRREEGFNVVDRIQLTIHASEALLKAIQDNREYVMSETLTTDLIESDTAQSLSFEIDEHRLSLSISKAV